VWFTSLPTVLFAGCLRPGSAARWQAGAVAAVSVLACAATGPVIDIAAAASTARLVMERTPLRAAAGGKVVGHVDAYTAGGDRARLLVLTDRTDEHGTRWLELLLPTRPNGSTGWIKADQALLADDPYEVRISTRSRKLQLLNDGKVVLTTGIVIGAAPTPTPHGQFAIYDRYRATGTVLAPWVLELTAHSDVLHEYAGGPGRIAIHGMTGALRAPVGTARSHGCVRVPTAPLRALAKVVPLGTPVRIVRAPLSQIAPY